MSVRTLLMTVLLAAALPALAQEAAKAPASWPGYQEADYAVSNYKFTGGETERGGPGGQRCAAVAREYRHRRELVSRQSG